MKTAEEIKKALECCFYDSDKKQLEQFRKEWNELREMLKV